MFKKMVITALFAFVSMTAVAFANETNTSFGSRSWQFDTSFDKQIKLNQATAVKIYGNKRPLGVRSNRRGGFGGPVYIGRVDTFNGAAGTSTNCLNCSTVTTTGNNNGVSVDQTGNNNGQTATTTVSGNAVGESSNVSN